MVTNCEVVPEQPLAFVTVTAYVPATLGLIDAEVAPVFHAYVKPAGALSVAVLPWQATNVPLIVGTGLLLMVTSCDVEPTQPLASVTVTVKVPAALGLIAAVVAPLLHT